MNAANRDEPHDAGGGGSGVPSLFGLRRYRSFARPLAVAAAASVAIAFTAAIVVSNLPGFPMGRQDHTGLPPWEVFPEQGGVRYLAKAVRNPGREPTYLALLSYETDADVAALSAAFGFVPTDRAEPVHSMAETLKPVPEWFPLDGRDRLYHYPPSADNYIGTMWVDVDAGRAVIERSWW